MSKALKRKRFTGVPEHRPVRKRRVGAKKECERRENVEGAARNLLMFPSSYLTLLHLVNSKGCKALVTPCPPGGELVDGDFPPHGVVNDLRGPRSLEGARVLLLPANGSDVLAVALAVVDDAVGGIEVDGLEGAHEGPAQAEALRDGGVDVLGRADAILHEAPGLHEEGVLQPVDDESVDLLAEDDRGLPEAEEELASR